MNEISLIKQLFKAPKTKKGWFYTFLIIFLILTGLLAIFLPSPKPVKASDVPFMYQNEKSALGTYNQFSRQVSYQKNITANFSGKVKSVVLWPYGNCDYSGSYFYFEPYLNNQTTGGGCSFTYTTSTKTSSGACIFDHIVYCSDSGGLNVSNGDILQFWTTNTTNGDGANSPSNRFYGSATDLISGNAYASGQGGEAPITGVSDLAFQIWGTTTQEYIPPSLPSFDITSPSSGSTKTGAFNVVGDYNTQGQNFNRLMIIFEDWDASSTCPLYTDADFQTQYSLYFNSQSKPYFSNYIYNATGTATIAIDDLPKGNYRCGRCYLINETTGTSSPELCQNYTIIVPNNIPPSGIPSYYVGQTWEDFYATNTQKWATSTELFASLAQKISPILNWVGSFTADFKNLFNNASSTAMGEEIGGAIPTARGYLMIINSWFGGNLPIGEVFVFYLLTALIIIIFKIILSIWHFFRG